MAHYKIKNITGKLPKRHVDKDRVLNVEYHVGFQKKFRKLNAGEEILLTCKTLPVSIHTLRTKNLITIIEINENEFNRLQKPSAKKVPAKVIEKPEVKEISKVDLDNDDFDDEDEEDDNDDDTKTTSSSSRKKTRKKTTTTTTTSKEVD